MNKILLAINSQQINANTLEFACYLARLTHSRLTGVFLEAEQEATGNLEKIQSTVINNVLKGNNGYPPKQPDEAKRALAEKNINFFKSACDKRWVNSQVVKGNGAPEDEIINASRFADLLVINPELNFSQKNEGVPSRFTTSVLNQAECPVLLSSDSFDTIDEILFCYDGSRSAVFAMKQFAYLFPEFNNKKVQVLDVEKEEVEIKEKDKIKDWLKVRYAEVAFTLLHGNIREELFLYLLKRKNVLVVMGAFGRNAVSSFIRPSSADLVIKALNLPLFITHQ